MYGHGVVGGDEVRKSPTSLSKKKNSRPLAWSLFFIKKFSNNLVAYQQERLLLFD